MDYLSNCTQIHFYRKPNRKSYFLFFVFFFFCFVRFSFFSLGLYALVSKYPARSVPELSFGAGSEGSVGEQNDKFASRFFLGADFYSWATEIWNTCLSSSSIVLLESAIK